MVVTVTVDVSVVVLMAVTVVVGPEKVVDAVEVIVVPFATVIVSVLFSVLVTVEIAPPSKTVDVAVENTVETEPELPVVFSSWGSTRAMPRAPMRRPATNIAPAETATPRRRTRAGKAL